MTRIIQVSLLIGGLLLSSFSGAALAQVEEIRLGVLDHDVNVTGNGAGGKEDGVNIAGEIVFASPDFLQWAWSPRPFVNLSVNTHGETSFGGAGLAWQTDIGNRYFAEFDFGVVYHDGISNLPTDPGDPVRIRLDATRVILGSDLLFRSVLGLGFHVNDQWDASIVFEHLSHGQILAQGRNEGLDNIGIRFSRKFGN
ncbi:MAG: acyloxyacyl hydrolase [Robiginitomaculum sp.]|nr:acyloxyacyl hydrolase [Robiginitomaculum sp.]